MNTKMILLLALGYVFLRGGAAAASSTSTMAIAIDTKTVAAKSEILAKHPDAVLTQTPAGETISYVASSGVPVTIYPASMQAQAAEAEQIAVGISPQVTGSVLPYTPVLSSGSSLPGALSIEQRYGSVVAAQIQNDLKNAFLADLRANPARFGID